MGKRTGEKGEEGKKEEGKKTGKFFTQVAFSCDEKEKRGDDVGKVKIDLFRIPGGKRQPTRDEGRREVAEELVVFMLDRNRKDKKEGKPPKNKIIYPFAFDRSQRDSIS